MMSVTLATSSGSVENLNVSARHGVTPNAFHALVMVTWSSFSRAASSRRRPVRHPEPGRWRGQRLGDDRALVDRRRPARPVLSTSPRQTLVEVASTPQVHRRPGHPDPLGDLSVLHPSEANNTILARWARPARTEDDRVSRTS